MWIREPADIRRAAETLAELVGAIGAFRPAPSHDISSKQPMVDAEGSVLCAAVFGWTDPSEWWWSRQHFGLSSPLPAACRHETEPFWVNAEGFRTRHPNHRLAEIDLTNFRERAVTSAAIVVPVHMAYSQIGAVSYCPLDASRTDLSDDFRRHANYLEGLSRSFVASYSAVLRQHRSGMDATRLTPREVQCLGWAAAGKTDFEISRIIATSQAAVKFHIRNASAKLSAVNRAQAVYKATQLGYIAAR